MNWIMSITVMFFFSDKIIFINFNLEMFYSLANIFASFLPRSGMIYEGENTFLFFKTGILYPANLTNNEMLLKPVFKC